jgi:hypothetical protein
MLSNEKVVITKDRKEMVRSPRPLLGFSSSSINLPKATATHVAIHFSTLPC